jgi:CheY-like chemotaxis protein
MSTPSPSQVDVLLVDDRPGNILALTAILDLPDYRLVTASSGQEALDQAARDDHDFALVLLDVAMPGMTGFDVADRLKADERTRHLPIVFVTAEATGMDDVYRAYGVGAVDYLIKPLDIPAVRAKVAVFADLYRHRRQLEELARQRCVTTDQRLELLQVFARDLRNPLASLVMQVRVARTALAGAEPVAALQVGEWLERIELATNAMSRLVSHLFELERVETGDAWHPDA